MIVTKKMKRIISNLSLFTFLLFSIGCKAQGTIIPLNHSGSYPEATSPIYSKDINNIRNDFIGVWRGADGNRKLELYIYKKDRVQVGLKGADKEYFKDALFGYYIYKENDIEILNTRPAAEENNDVTKIDRAPIIGFTNDGRTFNFFMKDFGIVIVNSDGRSFIKKGNATLNISNTDASPLQAEFIIDNSSYGIKGENYNYNFSIPRELNLTKISNILPPFLN